MANSGSVKIDYNGVTLPAYVDSVMVEVAEVFEADIKPMAQELSPVEFGTNRRSITTEVHRNETPDKAIQGEIFTQSGYGGYLELGHRVSIGPRSGKFIEVDTETGEDRMVQGRPYIYPAFIAFLPALLQAAKTGWEKSKVRILK